MRILAQEPEFLPIEFLRPLLPLSRALRFRLPGGRFRIPAALPYAYLGIADGRLAVFISGHLHPYFLSGLFIVLNRLMGAATICPELLVFGAIPWKRHFSMHLPIGYL